MPAIQTRETAQQPDPVSGSGQPPEIADGKTWVAVCAPQEIVRNTGVCALVNGRQIAVFHIVQGEAEARHFAIDNFDPNCQAAVLSRGIVGSIGERIVVASPLYKQHFDLMTGECLEVPENSVRAHPTRVADGMLWIAA
ncbi:MAG: nitrite reductase small subunit NirD [Janthinobacterium lividum]